MTEREAEDTKQRLIAVAGEVFAEQGFRSADRPRDLSRGAGQYRRGQLLFR